MSNLGNLGDSLVSLERGAAAKQLPTFQLTLEVIQLTRDYISSQYTG